MRTKKGTVTSAKMTGTVGVTVDAFVFHPVYRKRYRRNKKFLADANGHDLYEGDLVRITECRPISKCKHFKVTEVLEKAPRVDVMKEEEGVEEAMHHHKSHVEKPEEEKTEKTPPDAQ
jgi:small subunit ribosomal protein S17